MGPSQELLKRLGINEVEDLAQVREFFDPHPGLAGAGARSPQELQRIAQELDGKRLSLSEARQRFVDALGEGYEVKVLGKSIGIKSPGDASTGYHMWKAISHRE